MPQPATRSLPAAALALFAITSCTSAFADEDYYPPGILSAGQTRVDATFKSRHAAREFIDPTVPYHETDTYREESFGLRLVRGYAGNYEFSADLPLLVDRTTSWAWETPTGAFQGKSQQSGFADITLGAKYRAVREEDAGYRVVLGATLKPRTASRGSGGTGTTDLAPSVFVSRHSDVDSRYYLGYVYRYAENPAPNFQWLIAGSNLRLQQGMWLLPEVQLSRRNSFGRSAPSMATVVSLGLAVDVGKGVTFHPSWTTVRGRGYQSGNVAFGPLAPDNTFSVTMHFLY